MKPVLRAAVMVIGLVLVCRGWRITKEACHPLLTRPDIERRCFRP